MISLVQDFWWFHRVFVQFYQLIITLRSTTGGNLWLRQPDRSQLANQRLCQPDCCPLAKTLLAKLLFQPDHSPLANLLSVNWIVPRQPTYSSLTSLLSVSQPAFHQLNCCQLDHSLLANLLSVSQNAVLAKLLCQPDRSPLAKMLQLNCC